jgi:CarD family transcriptional regulator
MAKSKATIEIGSQRFYPPHGVVALMAVEDREFHGNSEEFHVLELLRGGTLLVPTKALSRAGFRPLVSANKAKELVKRMKSKAKLAPPPLDTKERSILYAEQLKAGDADEYTAILRDLLIRGHTAKITSGEEKLLEIARTYFVDEVGSVLKLDAVKLLADVQAAATPQEESDPPEKDED